MIYDSISSSKIFYLVIRISLTHLLKCPRTSLKEKGSEVTSVSTRAKHEDKRCSEVAVAHAADVSNVCTCTPGDMHHFGFKYPGSHIILQVNR